MIRKTIPIVWLLVLVSSPVQVAAAPDLTGSVEVEVVPVPNANGQVPVKFYITLENKGDETCTADWWSDFWSSYPCDLTEHPDDCAVQSDWYLKASEFLNLSAGQTVGPEEYPEFFELTEYVTPTNATFSYLLYVDSLFGGFCEEETEENNLVGGYYEVPLAILYANLKVEGASIDNHPDNPGNVVLTAVVKNIGHQPTDGPTHVDFFLQGDCANVAVLQGVFGAQLAEVPAGLLPGDSVEVQVIYTDLPPGDYYPIAIVNHAAEIEEYLAPGVQFDPDNCYDMGLFVQPLDVNKPDLIVEEFLVATSANNVIYYEGFVRNQGYVPVEKGDPWKLCVWFNNSGTPNTCEVPDVFIDEGDIIAMPQQGDDEGECSAGDTECVEEGYGCDLASGMCLWDGLQVDERVRFSKSIGFLPNGKYEVWVRADCDCEITESKEKNNDQKFDLIVDLDGPDLAVKMFNCSEKHVEVGGKEQSSVCYLTMVENLGNEPAPPFSVDVFYDLPEAPDPDSLGSEGQYYFQENGLDPGETVQIPPMCWNDHDGSPGVPEGTYTSWVVLDIMGEIWEPVEVNNLESCETEVVGVVQGIPNLVVDSFTCKVKGNTIEFCSGTKNAGNKAVGADKPFRLDVYFNWEDPPGYLELGDYHQEVVTGVKPSQTVDWCVKRESVPDGEYWNYFIADSQMQINESPPDQAEVDNFSAPCISVVDTDAQACKLGELINSVCVCGEETVFTGFCCDEEWYAVGCPEVVDGYAEEVTGGDGGPSVVEFGNGLGSANGDCGCRLDRSGSPSAGSFLIFMLAALAVIICRRKRA